MPRMTEGGCTKFFEFITPKRLIFKVFYPVFYFMLNISYVVWKTVEKFKCTSALLGGEQNSHDGSLKYGPTSKLLIYSDVNIFCLSRSISLFP